MSEPTAAAAEALAELVSPGEIVNIVSLTPKLDKGWELLATGNIVQMVWRDDAPTPDEDFDRNHAAHRRRHYPTCWD